MNSSHVPVLLFRYHDFVDSHDLQLVLAGYFQCSNYHFNAQVTKITKRVVANFTVRKKE